jgi:hypothetical protein
MLNNFLCSSALDQPKDKLQGNITSEEADSKDAERHKNVPFLRPMVGSSQSNEETTDPSHGSAYKPAAGSEGRPPAVNWRVLWLSTMLRLWIRLELSILPCGGDDRISFV